MEGAEEWGLLVILELRVFGAATVVGVRELYSDEQSQ